MEADGRFDLPGFETKLDAFLETAAWQRRGGIKWLTIRVKPCQGLSA